ncbi:MAG: efflux transporter periplasmic adaptor subunit [Zetaproteobacteria bacterium CG12_big_fil_rev_8_21_14_0_65_55_1124]|nr:MAG: efflux transporter periplasmic adaptor subunit [Zetaproteobacteria bacterium CG1_02_55_237]PIS18502.1 MAG: efflux transporter periplasmic adaptor subunit [Zetaproteobacteria bacterium CG08_land_8_20_14_0_20_55_17]PIW43036.1 MAG: efflux transporter periplasmic adaptor subunit [Zetaproteobacteria bacterium CG12_big_fil_rev_8_21_14_0_65_55_1124]PIY52597.1 MAG: efflux transporter periplasmic adaptor subunit [Zetaproteobacteria bacterium CG_4_10_14_0_8_um_filter_55_43]PIZ36842.1 MAG: efflux 
MTKRMIIMLVLVGLVFGGIFGYQAFKSIMMKKYMSAMGMPPQTVSTMLAEEQSWQPTIESVGSLSAVRGADLSTEVPGIVSEIHFSDGEDVRADSVLMGLNADSDIARLHSLQAARDLAASTYQRDKAQFGVKAISQQALDASDAALRQARANLAEQQALVNKKVIRAPFAGRLGARNVDVGQYVNAGTAIVTLQALDPIYADFYLPQQSLGMVSVGQDVTLKTDAWPDKGFAGKITVIDPKVDVNTRNVRVRALLKNAEKKLLPGMYVSVDIVSGQARKYITLPQTAVTYNPYGNIVYLVEDQGKDDKGRAKLIAKQVPVTTGKTRGDQVAILSGVKPGDTVVTTGQIKLRNGSPVAVNNSIQPGNDPDPKPKDE